MKHTAAAGKTLQGVWWAFASSAQGSVVHPLDLEKFWRFVLLARRQKHALEASLITQMEDYTPIDPANRERLISLVQDGAALLNLIYGPRKVDQ
ncbi:MAG: hypothetical protein AAFQ36_12415 [Pseudomonadota bacterium]